MPGLAPSSPSTNSRWQCLTRKLAAGGLSRRPHACGRQSDALLRAGLQPRRKPSLRQHGLDSPIPLADGQEEEHRERRGGLQLQRMARSRPSALFTLPLAAACAGPQDAGSIGDVEGDKGVPFPAAIAVVGPAGRGKTAGRRQPLRRCSAARSRPPAESRSASISQRAMPCPRPIPSPSPSRRTASAPLSLCGTLRRLWNSTWPKERWAASWRCSSLPTPLPRARTPAPSSSHRMAALFTWRWPTATPLPRSMLAPGSSP